MLSPDSPISAIPRAQKRLVPKLCDLDLFTIRDLLYHFPAHYIDFSTIKKISELKRGETATIRGEVKDAENRRAWSRRMMVTEALVSDQTGSIRAVWFNQPYIMRQLTRGKTISIAGKITNQRNALVFLNPNYEIVKIGAAGTHTGKIIAIYPETKGLTSKGIRYFIKLALEYADTFPDPIPEEIRASEHLPEINRALLQIHAPENPAEMERAENRFAFEELFYLQLFNLQQKSDLAKNRAPEIKVEVEEIKATLVTLPFELTKSQKQALWDIVRDVMRAKPMNRLLQGDVGSGKTVVVALAAIFAARNGYQTTFMAPTEILARQHYHTLIKLFPKANPGIALLTSSESRIYYGDNLKHKTKKPALKKAIAAGGVKIVIGTHALIQKDVKFRNLALIIVDEQHRFGVKQRMALTQKQELIPHFLSMSATPIPRTLSLTIFSDLDLSIISELPKNRKPIITKIIDPKNRLKAYQFIKSEIKKGRQAFVICPHIEQVGMDTDYSPRASALLDVKSVKQEYEKLSKRTFPDLRVNMLHGKMKPAEKEKVMREFSDGQSDILVSTSVVEVGVDVPNASIMMIESAERFGLSQLYQFRGRVGRGGHQSYCLLFTESRVPETRQRLRSVEGAKNGFELAEIDLRLRGPGEFFGDAQTGMPDLAMRALQNPHLIKTARAAALRISLSDPGLKNHPFLTRQLTGFHGRIHRE